MFKISAHSFQVLVWCLGADTSEHISKLDLLNDFGWMGSLSCCKDTWVSAPFLSLLLYSVWGVEEVRVPPSM